MSDSLFIDDSELPKKKILGERLKQLRKENGLSQQEIANLFKVTRPCVCYWETGKRLPDYQTLIALSEYYDVSLDYLVGRCNHKQAMIEAPKETYQLQDVLDLSVLTDDNKAAVKKFYQYLLEGQMVKKLTE